MAEATVARGQLSAKPDAAVESGASERVPRRIIRPPLWLSATLAVFLLLVGAARVMSAPYTDAAEYQCYALAFWAGSPTGDFGSHAATVPSAAVCAFYLNPLPAAPFHTLPREYGPLALLVFSLPLVGPSALYPWIFALLMALIVVGLALLLRRVGAAGSGHAWLLYVMLGSMATAAARFDVVPAACTLLALVALRRGRQGWAYAALAAGTLLKLYPALLLPLFLIETWRSPQWGTPQRRSIAFWRGPAVYVGVVALVEGAAALLNPAAVLAPLSFMQGRCVQVESLPATLSALGTLLRGHPLAFKYSPQYNSICQVSLGLDLCATLCTVLALAGIVGVVVLFWLGSKRPVGEAPSGGPRPATGRFGRLSLGLAACLVLALAMLGSKVFSPQYLLWISPLVAWEYGLVELRAFLGWSLVCLATTLCYPLAYTSLLLVALQTIPNTAVPLTAGLRNALLIALIVVALTQVLRSRRAPSYAARTSPGSPSGG